MSNDKLIKLGDKIIQQLGLESQLDTADKSIGYFEGNISETPFKKWILRNQKAMQSFVTRDIHGNVQGLVPGVSDTIYTTSNSISRDSLVGKYIIQGVGNYEYDTPVKKNIQAIVDILTTYASDNRGDAVNGSISFLENNQVFNFSSLIRDIEKIRTLSDEIDESSNLLKEELAESEAAQELTAQIELKEKELKTLKEKVEKHIAHEVALRDQPILDKYQEEVKRSQILKGSLIINGGPGTGKTTSLIQRITFLTSETVEEEVGELTQEGKDILFNNKAWVFYSPSELLRNYLASAMSAEGLVVTEESVRTWDTHRKALLRQTGLINSETFKPFVSKSIKDGNTFFKSDSALWLKLNTAFLSFILNRQTNKVERMNSKAVLQKLNTSLVNSEAESYILSLRTLAIKMSDSSKRALKFRKIDSWVPFYISFQNEFQEFFKDFNKELSKEIKNEASRVQVAIKNKEAIVDWLRKLVIEEIRNRQELNNEEDEYEIEEEEEQFDIEHTIDVQLAVNRKIVSFIRNYSLHLFDKSNVKLSPRNKELLEKLSDYLKTDKLESFGIRLFFKRNFEKPTKGLEANLFGEIPAVYKQFRRGFFVPKSKLLTDTGLSVFESNLKQGNKHLYPEEADYILAFIFGLSKRLYQDRKLYWKQSSHRYLETYKDNIRGVVAVDEATDFSIWELVVMTQLSHPLFGSTTLSGDLMQRFTSKGIKNWESYAKLFKDTEIKDLKIAYRQTAKLIDIAAGIYNQYLKKEATFKSHFKDDPLDPDPLIFTNKDDDKKHAWLVDRIMDIQRLYGKNFPSVAIFVNNDMEAMALAKSLNKFDKLEEIGVEAVACVEGKILGDRQSVRIYSAEYIKGLEFGAVFYYNLDSIDIDKDLMFKYVYVGLSRANLFLGVTTNRPFEGELSYLNRYFKDGNWKSLQSQSL
jgi:hypothetical protein